MKKHLFFLAAISALMWGCDYVEVPQQAGGSPVHPTSDTIRRIFIEDFTGHTCPNCPNAARRLDSLQHAYPDQIVGMAVHILDYAEPCPPHALPFGANAGTFTEDFRAPAETVSYDGVFGTGGFPLPEGFVNRAGFPSTIMTEVSDWASKAAIELSKPMTAYLKITPTYNVSTRSLTVNVSGEFMVDTTGTFNIALFLLEDSLTGAQTDNTLSGGIEYNYVFNHVLRGCINSPGSSIGLMAASGTIPAHTGINYTTTNSFTVSSAYNDNHCRIIAILTNASDYGVLQAAECDLR